MNCLLSAIYGIGMVMATFATMTVTKEQHDVLRKKLSPELDIIYTAIANERRNHYVQGLLLGLVVSYFLISYIDTRNLFYKTSFVLSITTSISVLYYFIMPKSDYMLNHLKTQEENKAWLTVYKAMKQRYVVGFILGSLAAIPFALSMCNSNDQ